MAEKKLLVLDLDECLIHSVDYMLVGAEHDFKSFHYYTYKRPHLDEFIQFALSTFDVAVWTSGTADYAEIIVKNIFPNPDDLKFVWARDRCSVGMHPDYGQFWLKEFKKIKRKGYDLNKVIGVDDSPEKYLKNWGNLVRVAPFEGHPDDELFWLQKYLEVLNLPDNIREIDKRWWKSKVKNVLKGT